MPSFVFDRARSPDAYAHQLAHLYNNGYRIYDPSIAASRDPEAEKKMMRWPPFATQFQLRHSSIAGRKWTCSPHEDTGEAGALLAGVATSLLGNIKGFTQARINLARADVSGSRYAEIRRRTITAPYGDGKRRQWVVPVGLIDMPKENFRWDPVAGGAPSRELKYARKNQGSVRWVKVPPYAPLIRHLIGDSEESHGYGKGLRDVLFFLFNASTRVFQADIQAAERMGHGWIVLKLDADADGDSSISNEDLQAKGEAALIKHRAKHNFVIGKNDEIEMLAPPGSQSDFMGALFERLVQMGDRLISGGTLFSGGGSSDTGSFARAETEADTSSIIFDTLSDFLEETITDQLLVPCLRDNWTNLVELGLGELLDTAHPTYEVVRGRKRDPKAVADWLEVATRAGVPITVNQALDLLDLEPAAEGDEMLTPPQPAGGDPFGAIGGIGQDTAPSADSES